MRKSPILDALFPGVRGSILGATLLRPEKEWYLSELAGYLGLRPSSLQREVESLSGAGVLEQRKDGRRVYLKPDVDSPVFAELKSLFEKTAGAAVVLQNALEPLGEQLRVAFVYGSMARSSEGSRSDIDLMVVGEAGMLKLVPHLRQAERILGRPINTTRYPVEEFRCKVRGSDHFLKAVLRSEKLFVRGGALELAAITGEG